VARKGLLESNQRKKSLVAEYAQQRKELKGRIMNRENTLEDRFEASLKLAKMPRSSSKVRVRNRCAETGRPRGVYTFCGLSRIFLRQMAVHALLPGVRRSSW
jgi:small subunit ribosomal protein S14